MPQPTAGHPARLAVSSLSQRKPTRFLIQPEAEERARLAEELGIQGIRKLRFEGELRASGKHDWLMQATLGATVVQDCVVTLEPVTTRIDTPVMRLFSADAAEDAARAGETEMPQDDTVEPLGEWICPASVMAETLALELPAYPRAAGLDTGAADMAQTPQGPAPVQDSSDDPERPKPFAALAALKDKLEKGEG